MPLPCPKKAVVAVENADDQFFGRLSGRQLETYSRWSSR
jgi:hypothetical protein